MPTKPEPAIPNPAARLPGEIDILANVLADLSDEHAKLVYADWLEERDDPRGPLLRTFVAAYRAGTKLPALKSAPRPWRDLVGITLMALLRETALASRADQLLALARPSLSFATVSADERTIPVGASRFGGRPDLPAGEKWPKFQGQPLAFLGQFNLGELRASPVSRALPAAGVLSVFCRYDEDEGNDDFPKGSWRLFYFPDPARLDRHEPDDELPDGSRFTSCRLTFTEALTLPDPDSPWRGDLGVGEDDDADDVYSDLIHDLGTDSADHLLGYPFPIQGDVLGKKTVRHLVSIYGNDETGWEWGDGGALYFTLPEADLKRGRFDRVEMVMDCG